MNALINNRRYVIFAIVVLVAMFALSGWAWTQIPADTQIPTHFGVDGQPDSYGGKFEGLFLMPLVSVAVMVLMAFVPRFEPRRRNMQMSGKAYRALWIVLGLFFLALHVSIVLTALGYNVPMNLVISIALGLMFVVIGNYMGKIRSTFMFGIRTPWTLASDLSWNKTHRLGGKLFVASGLAILITGIFAPSLMVWVMLAFLAGVVLISFVYSYLVWRSDPEVQTQPQS